MLVTRIGGFEGVGTGIDAKHDVDDVFEFEIVDPGSNIDAVAGVVANALGRDPSEGVIEKLDAAGRPFAALFEIEIRTEYIPARKLRIVDLEDEPRIHDPAVFLAKRFGNGEAVLFLARVVFVFVPIGELRRRDRRHEGFDMRNTGKRLLEIVDVSFECLLSVIGDGAGANPFDRGRLSGSSR